MFVSPTVDHPFFSTAVASRPAVVKGAESATGWSSRPKHQSAARRAISPQSGRALEILGHAIEYLTDEYIHERGILNPQDTRIESVQLLMALNRQVYSECPELPAFTERCRSIVHSLFVRHHAADTPMA